MTSLDYYRSVGKSYYRSIGYSGLVKAIKAKALGKNSYIEVVRPELRFPVQLRIPSTDVQVFEQVFLETEYDFTAKKLPKVIIDAGANIGLASIYFANKYPHAMIIAIEPEAANFKLLQKNVGMYTNIVPIQAALWNSNRSIQLMDPGRGSWAFTTTESAGVEGIEANADVEAITIDTLMERFRLDVIDILKVDIEGAEKEVFESIPVWLDKVQMVVIETHDRIKPGSKASVQNAMRSFPEQWRRGENDYFSRFPL